jgi:hypothetical protein
MESCKCQLAVGGRLRKGVKENLFGICQLKSGIKTDSTYQLFLHNLCQFGGFYLNRKIKREIKTFENFAEILFAFFAISPLCETKGSFCEIILMI